MSIFTKIIQREIPSDILHEDEHLIVIKDINPQKNTHLLIIPKKEIPSINQLEETDSFLIAHMFFIAQQIAKKIGVAEGYQLHFNVGEKGGQEIMHLHMHLLSDL